VKALPKDNDTDLRIRSKVHSEDHGKASHFHKSKKNDEQLPKLVLKKDNILFNQKQQQ